LSILEASIDDDGQYSDNGDDSGNNGDRFEVEGWDNLLLEEDNDNVLTVGMNTESD
jgi:hypothetical protein